MSLRATRKQKLKYCNEICDIDIYDWGLELWKDIDYIFSGYECRSRVIIRVDAIKTLTDLFERNTLERYRTLIWILAAGLNTDVKFISQTLITLMKHDSVFASRLREIYYCEQFDISFGEYILRLIASQIKTVEDRYRIFFRGKSESVFCCSGGYLYISIPDEDASIHLPNDNLKVEVVSFAKNWKGLIKKS